MPKPDIKDFKNVLCVEGYSDLLFVAEMLADVGRQAFIQEFNGRHDMGQNLRVFLTPQLLSEKAAIGVIVDADRSAQSAFLSLQNVLEVVTKQKVLASGSWAGTTPRIGLIIVPDAASPGEIESLVWRSWLADARNAPIAKCIDAYERCLSASGLTAQSTDKARIGALLAFRNDEDPRLGPGARAKAFDLRRPELADLRTFLEGLPT